MHPYFRTGVIFAGLLAAVLFATAFVVVGKESRQRVAQAATQPATAPIENPPGTGGPGMTPAPASPGGTPATVMDDKQVSSILGKNIRGKDGEDMGRIVDVIVSRAGQLRGAVIDFGGFLGVGSRKIAVDWNALRFGSANQPDLISLDLTKEQVRVAPEYKTGVPVVMLGASTPAQSEGGSAPPMREK